MAIRKFKSGATRDTDEGKIDYAGFLHPKVIEAFGKYMHKHRMQTDGSMRASDNWKKGMPRDELFKSGMRHFMDWWLEHEGFASREGMMDALMGLMFNVQGYALEVIRDGESN